MRPACGQDLASFAKEWLACAKPYECDIEYGSLDPPGFLPDGSEFKKWEPETFTFSKTYYVNQSDPQASDNNPGSEELPFKTINRAAQVLQPGERVVVGEGIYRECVRPACGGTGPESMISYETAPGAEVIIKGSELLNTQWVASFPWVKSPYDEVGPSTVEKIWMVNLPSELFIIAYNPFAICNYPQVDEMPWWDLGTVFSDPKSLIYLQCRGLIFQDGRRLKQVRRYSDLFVNEGAFWVETHGLTIHVSPYEGINPNDAEWEITTREQIFAPVKYGLDYIRVKGFIMRYAGNGFPFPQRGAISTMHGNHWIIEDNQVEWVNAVGIDLTDQGMPQSHSRDLFGYHIVRGNILNDCGICGICGPGLRDTLIENNILRRNAWHDVERLAECAAMKLHTSQNLLVRRNLVIDMYHGTGIYLDMGNSNSRITQNVVINTGSNNPDAPGPGTGGIYVEAAFSNMVDNNFVWGSETNGIYAFFTGNLVVAHNMIGNCAGAGVMLLDNPGRPAGNPGGGNQVLNNILVNNGLNVAFYQSDNSSDYNLFGNVGSPSTAFQVREDGQNLDLAGGRTMGLTLIVPLLQLQPNLIPTRWNSSGPSRVMFRNVQ